ncbi:protocatechuate dioxygenase [Streptomyces sp. Ru87]|nr:protocatechuate dioxygenase [Streptomyces sp. Ru87]
MPMTPISSQGPRSHGPKHKAPSPVSRRRVLLGGAAVAAAGGLGVAGMASAGGAGSATGTATAGTGGAPAVCSLLAQATEGPYALPGALVRSDIAEDKPGFPLRFLLTVVDQNTGCAPLADALVELWHCDHLGEYSGFVGGNGHEEADNGTFCRGAGMTDENGQVELTTIWPGHYRGRAVHVHLRVHTDVTLTEDSYTGGELVHTGQLFFDPQINAQVQAAAPYTENTTPETDLDEDSVYDGGGAASGLVTLFALGESVTDGYAATLTLGVDA